MVRAPGERSLAAVFLILLTATAIAGCIAPTDMEPENEPKPFPSEDSIWYRVESWPTDGDYLLARITAEHPKRAWLNISYLEQSSYRSGILNVHVQPSHEEEKIVNDPIVLDVLREHEQGDWTTVQGAAQWDWNGPFYRPYTETLSVGVEHAGAGAGFDVGTSLVAGGIHMGSRADLQNKTYEITPGEPLLVLLYSPRDDHDDQDGLVKSTRELEMQIAVDPWVSVELLQGKRDVVREADRLPVGEGERFRAEVSSYEVEPIDGQGGSQATGTPVQYTTKGPTLFFVHAFATGTGTTTYTYLPPDHEMVQARVTHPSYLERETVADGNNTQYHPRGAIGPGGTWTFHLIEQDCSPESGVFQRPCTDAFHVAQLGDTSSYQGGLKRLQGPPDS